ncbi:MAG: lytic transglycosylase domain-containing protein [Acidobacteriota bacterium]
MQWIWILFAMPACAQVGATPAQRASLLKQRTSVMRQRKTVPVLLAPSNRVWSSPAIARTLPAFGCEPMNAPALTQMINTAARANQLEPDVVREVARQESAFRPCAVSNKGAEGLMQLMPATQALLGVNDPFDPSENLMAGARLLKDLLGRYKGNLSLALSAYNAGTVRVDRDAAIPEITETQNYVASILERLGQ